MMKLLKDANMAEVTHFMKFYVWCFAPSAVIGAVYGAIKAELKGIFIGVSLAFAGSFILASLGLYIVTFVGNTAGSLYGGRRPSYSLRELFEGDLNRVKYLKMKKRYQEAMDIVDMILKKAPELPEALFYKAQILWEGDKNPWEAKKYLERIKKLPPDESEPFQRWAESLLHEISKKSGKRPV